MTKRWTPPTEEEVRRAVEVAIADLEVLEREIESEQSEATHARLLRAEFWGIRAATRKRLAEVEYLYSGDWRRTLRAALRDYEKGMEQGVQVDHWILGQYVVLRCVLADSEPPEPTTATDREPLAFWWSEAHRSAMGAIRGPKPDARMWAHSTVADLLMVAQALGLPPTSSQTIQPEAVVDQLRQMIAAAGGEDTCPALWPTFRQFWRWRFWWTNPGWEQAARLGYDYLWSLVEPRLHLETAAEPAVEEQPKTTARPRTTAG